MSQNIEINLDNINYDSLFRISRYTSRKLGKVLFFNYNKSLIRLIFFKIKFLETQGHNPKIINSYQRKDYSNFIDNLLLIIP